MVKRKCNSTLDTNVRVGADPGL